MVLFIIRAYPSIKHCHDIGDHLIIVLKKDIGRHLIPVVIWLALVPLGECERVPVRPLEGALL